MTLGDQTRGAAAPASAEWPGTAVMEDVRGCSPVCSSAAHPIAAHADMGCGSRVEGSSEQHALFEVHGPGPSPPTTTGAQTCRLALRIKWKMTLGPGRCALGKAVLAQGGGGLAQGLGKGKGGGGGRGTGGFDRCNVPSLLLKPLPVPLWCL